MPSSTTLEQKLKENIGASGDKLIDATMKFLKKYKKELFIFSMGVFVGWKFI